MEDPRIRKFAKFLINSAVGLRRVKKFSSSCTAVKQP